MTSSKTTIYQGDDAEKCESPLSNAYKLLTTDKKLTIGYFGGSITLGTSAERDGGDLSLSYVNRISNWFKENFPEAEIETVNAGVSDTATNFGLFRLQKTLMNENGHDMPDLVFVEFTVNDWLYDTQTGEDLQRQAESLYLNIWKCNPYAEIVCVVTQESADGTSRNAHLKVCNHYGIPLVDVGIPLLAAKTERGHAKESEGNFYYTVDNLHPSHRGYEIYFNEIEEKVLTPNIKGLTVESNNLYPYGKKLPNEIGTMLIKNPKILTVDNFTFSGSFKLKNTAFECDMYGTELSLGKVALTDKILSGNSRGTVTAEFNGTALGVMFMMNNSGINMSYSIDNGEFKTLKVDKDNFAFQMYAHPQVFMLSHSLSDEKHTVKLIFSPIDGSTDMNVEFGGLLVNN